MIFNPDHDQDVYKALNRFSDGLDFQALFNLTTLFSEEKELSIFLNRKITNGDVYKIDRLYYIADKHKNNALSVTEEIKSLIKNSPELSKFQEREEKRPPKVIQTEYFSKTVVKPLSEKATISQVALKREVSEDKKPAPINGKPLGNFNRSSMVGKYAYIFYRYRLYEPLSNSDLRRLIIHDKFTDSSHYQAIHGLKKNGFIRQVEKGRQSTFVWTGDYAYPFSSMKTEDAAGMKYKPEEYFDLLKTSHIEQATETVTENVTIEKIVQNTEIKETKSEKEIPKVEIPTKEFEIPVIKDFNPNFFLTSESHIEVKDYLDSRILKLEIELSHVKRIRSLLNSTAP